ncbi:DUF4282 domain-containing protein [Desulfocurvibacter africanus]|uniref:DUF4282 domain-containing protein n=1 Tax=Desulfocurvibacter africanus TaxID=873 RepID=UPI00041AA745|nr:DUF4282 domain-containing protein [Desulfocurvibacter africanus]
MDKDLMNHVFSFEKLITPKIIKFVYFFGLALIALAGLMGIFSGFGMMGDSFGGGFGKILLSLIGVVAGFVFLRMTCEWSIVFFGMYDRLGAIRAALPEQNSDAK